MKFANLKSQRGAVLAFSLMMLLLLTLAGTRMIQQNKQQLEISNNARLMAIEFSIAEAVLEDAKNVINLMPQHVDLTGLAINDSSHQCTPTAGAIQNIGLAKDITDDLTGNYSGTTVSAIITSVKCKSDGWVEQICSAYNSTTEKTICNPTNHPTECTVVDDTNAATIFNDPGSDPGSDTCYQDYDPQATLKLVETAKCPKEIYTIEITSTNTSGGATRKITSDHVVGCGG